MGHTRKNQCENNVIIYTEDLASMRKCQMPCYRVYQIQNIVFDTPKVLQNRFSLIITIRVHLGVEIIFLYLYYDNILFSFYKLTFPSLIILKR